MNEDILIRKAQKGDHQAFLALLERHDRQVMSVVYRFTGDLYHRQDLYQEIFLHCFRSIKKYHFRAAFSTWLYRLALNRCIDFMKRYPPPLVPEETAAPEVDWERREKLRAIKRALAKLKGPQQISFHLYYIEGWSIREITALLECGEGTVKSHLNRARIKVRRDREVLVWRTTPN